MKTLFATYILLTSFYLFSQTNKCEHLRVNRLSFQKIESGISLIAKIENQGNDTLIDSYVSTITTQHNDTILTAEALSWKPDLKPKKTQFYYLRNSTKELKNNTQYILTINHQVNQIATFCTLNYSLQDNEINCDDLNISNIQTVSNYKKNTLDISINNNSNDTIFPLQSPVPFVINETQDTFHLRILNETYGDHFPTKTILFDTDFTNTTDSIYKNLQVLYKFQLSGGFQRQCLLNYDNSPVIPKCDNLEVQSLTLQGATITNNGEETFEDIAVFPVITISGDTISKDGDGYGNHYPNKTNTYYIGFNVDAIPATSFNIHYTHTLVDNTQRTCLLPYSNNILSTNNTTDIHHTKIFPNPTTGTATVTLGEVTNGTIIIRTPLGQEVSQKHFIFSDHIEIELPEMSNIYLLEVKTDNGEITFLKVIKE